MVDETAAMRGILEIPMRAVPFLFSTLLTPVLLVACLFGGEDDTGFGPGRPYADAEVTRRISVIQDGLSELRGLEFSRPLRSALIASAAYRRQLATDVDRSVPESLDRVISREMAQLGYFNDTTDRISDYWKDFYGSFPGGYYIPGRDSIYIIAELKDNEEFMSMALPHELVHALQDQAHRAFDPARPVGTPGYYAGDFDLARLCLIEGDAEFTALAYFARHETGNPEPFLYAYEQAYERAGGYPNWKAMPDSLRLFATSGSPYDLGARYVADIHHQGGLPAVDAEYSLTAQTTLKVLTGFAGAPEPVDLDWLPDLLDTAGSYVDDFGNGSLQLMTAFLPGLTAEAFAKGMGWRGDRCFYRIGTSERWGDLVWVQVYASEADAASALAALKSLLPGRLGGGYSGASSAYPGDFDDSYRIEGLGLTSVLIRAGKEVWWVEGIGTRPGAVIEGLRSHRLAAVTVAGARPMAKPAARPERRSRMLLPDLGRVYFHTFRRTASPD